MHFCALAYAKPEFNTNFFNNYGHNMVQNTCKADYLEARLPRNFMYCGENHGSDEFSGKTSSHTSTYDISRCECYEAGFKQEQDEGINF